MSSEFHFSPRPNRANEIAWRAWGETAFSEARRDDKPILLSISAVWCHWCHVMDETSYSDPRVIAAINERFVPVRVDNDRRPDVNARYNQGGWPTTAFLAPAGELLAGATYMPPDQLLGALDQIATFYKENRTHVEERAAELRKEAATRRETTGELRETMIARVLEEIADTYDPEYGGFGSEPKFPMTDVLDFLLQEYRVTGDERLYEMVAKSMLAMAGGGTYDHVEGGFFRYSTTRDWSVPHFEKMTEDHAALLRILAELARTTRNNSFRATLESALRYVRTVLRDSKTHFFAGSQDADEAYFALPLEQRRKREAPYVDRTSYTNWTAAMAGAFALASAALDDDDLLREAEATLDALHDHMRDDDGLLFHYVEPGGKPQVRGLLADQSAYLRALLDAHECGGEPRFFTRARELAIAIERRFAAPDGGFYDHAGIEEQLGNLANRQRPLADNSLLAENFLRLASLANDEPRRQVAERTLQVYASNYGGMRMFAAPFARALRRYFSRELSVMLIGDPGETADLREAARALPDPMLTVCTISPGDSQALRDRGMDSASAPVAYLCRGNVCGSPARTTAELRTAFEQLA
ncbi:MAG TPA: DUF255 domain-containing protein [Candidatus Rubrimentiphilum sp.]|nr:DUF255 domain-containing protein [Candidatus Rubrimentiphilum sp.]